MADGRNRSKGWGTITSPPCCFTASTVSTGASPLGTSSLRNRPMMSPAELLISSPINTGKGGDALDLDRASDRVVIGNGYAVQAHFDAPVHNRL